MFLFATTFGLMALSSYGFLAASFACLSFLATFSARILQRYEFFVNAGSPETARTC
jgi:hypothetical protein